MSRRKRNPDSDNPHGWQQYGWVKVESAVVYLPSPEEITRKCAELRAAWPPEEYVKRAPHLTAREPMLGVHLVGISDNLEAMSL